MKILEKYFPLEALSQEKKLLEKRTMMQTSAKTSISLSSNNSTLSEASNAPQFAFGANVPTGGVF